MNPNAFENVKHEWRVYQQGLSTRLWHGHVVCFDIDLRGLWHNHSLAQALKTHQNFAISSNDIRVHQPTLF